MSLRCRRAAVAVSVGALMMSSCSAAIKTADEKAKPPPLLLGGFAQQYKAHAIKSGQGLLTLAIPRLSVDVLVVEGASDQALRAGAGHYADTPYPGHPGNVAIFGHRSTYGSPFAALDQLRVGDQVIVRTPVDRETYDVIPPFGGHSNPWVTTASDPSVLSQSGRLRTGHFLTLITNASGGHHLVARLRLVTSAPV
jgi:sortase A